MGNGDGRRLLPVGDALNAQHGLVSVLLDTDAVFLVEADAFGIENRRGGKLAIRRDRRFAVGDDRHRAGLVDDEAAGELAVDVVDVHGDFRGLVLVLLEKPEQLGGAGRHGPERHALSVDADGRLICAADRDHVMIAEDVAAGGLHQIMDLTSTPRSSSRRVTLMAYVVTVWVSPLMLSAMVLRAATPNATVEARATATAQIATRMRRNRTKRRGVHRLAICHPSMSYG